MAEKKQAELIRAAGGLVWRMNRNRSEILIIHRTRYDDWSLPKGKLKDGERWEEAAMREVAEETGYRVDILSFANDLFYYVSEKPKIVLFWNMHVKEKAPESERTTDSPDEVDRMKWVSLDEVPGIVTHEDEKELIKNEAARQAA